MLEKSALRGQLYILYQTWFRVPRVMFCRCNSDVDIYLCREFIRQLPGISRECPYSLDTSQAPRYNTIRDAILTCAQKLT